MITSSHPYSLEIYQLGPTYKEQMLKLEQARLRLTKYSAKIPQW